MTSATITAGPTGATLYTERVQAAIRRVAVSVSVKTGGEVDADELFSAGECKVAQTMHGFDPSRHDCFEAWACQCALWAMRSYLRSIDPVSRRDRVNGAEGGAIVHLDAQPEWFVDVVAGAVEPDRGEVADGFRRALVLIDGLPPTWRAVVRAHYLDGLTPAAIGRQMGRGGQHVSGILKKALAKLRAAYERPGPTTDHNAGQQPDANGSSTHRADAGASRRTMTQTRPIVGPASAMATQTPTERREGCGVRRCANGIGQAPGGHLQKFKTHEPSTARGGFLTRDLPPFKFDFPQLPKSSRKRP